MLLPRPGCREFAAVHVEIGTAAGGEAAEEAGERAGVNQGCMVKGDRLALGFQKGDGLRGRAFAGRGEKPAGYAKWRNQFRRWHRHTHPPPPPASPPEPIGSKAFTQSDWHGRGRRRGYAQDGGAAIAEEILKRALRRMNGDETHFFPAKTTELVSVKFPPARPCDFLLCPTRVDRSFLLQKLTKVP